MRKSLGLFLLLIVIITSSTYMLSSTYITSSTDTTSDVLIIKEYGNAEFLDSLNAALYNIINSGEIESIYSKWFTGKWMLTNDTNTNTTTEFPVNPTAGGTLDNIVKSGKIIFGADTTYPPFESIDINGQVVGYDVDIANAIATQFAKKYGVTVIAEMFTTTWDPIITDLINRNFDAILSAMTKTP